VCPQSDLDRVIAAVALGNHASSRVPIQGVRRKVFGRRDEATASSGVGQGLGEGLGSVAGESMVCREREPDEGLNVTFRFCSRSDTI
jgi:hypothetical protein